MKNRRNVRLIIGILTLFLLGCSSIGLGALGNLGRNANEANNSAANRAVNTPDPSLVFTAAPTAIPEAIIEQADAEELLLINLYERVNPSVVSLEVIVNTSSGTQPFLQPEGPPSPDSPNQPQEDFGPFNPRGEGSGFVYDEDGHIVTNSHVVEGAAAIYVTFTNGLELFAEIVGTDPDSDLAVIKVDAPDDLLVPVSWGDSSSVVVGQRAVAIGNPFGLAGSLTTGIVSGLGRNLLSLNQRFRIPEVIQTDAAINPGNSGGPLLNSRGEVIGVNSAIVPRQVGTGERSFLGVGFAVPANLALRVIPNLIADGEYRHPWMGVGINDVTAAVAQEMGLDKARGALVVSVLPNSPAEDAGLRAGSDEFITREGRPIQIGGDVIIKMGDEDINNFNDLISYLSRKGTVGEPTPLTVIRDGQEVELEIVLGFRPVSTR
ncbi:MAG: trypsin-like peptidase domain-containing protein [Chloroflexota bacterium]